MSSLETVDLEGVYFRENTPERAHGPHKSLLSLYKQAGEFMVMNDLEQPMLSYYVIHLEKFRKSCNEQRRKL